MVSKLKDIIVTLVACFAPLASAENIYQPPLPAVQYDGKVSGQNAGLVITRAGGEFAPTQLADVMVDGKRLTRLPKNSYIFVCVEPREMNVSTYLSSAIIKVKSTKSGIHIAPKAGETIFIEVPSDRIESIPKIVSPGIGEAEIVDRTPVGPLTNRDFIGRLYHDDFDSLPEEVVDCTGKL
jgi:hypothetical protein